LTVARRTTTRLCLSLLAIIPVVGSVPARGGEAGPPPRAIARVAIFAAGQTVLVHVVAPAVSLLGFAHQPRNARERATMRLATENLHTGDGLIRFNTLARCRLAKADVDAGLDIQDAQGHPEMSASYRFVCAQPDKLDSAALGLFVGFPVLDLALVQYFLPGCKGEAGLTRSQPVVSFIPLE
jgi:hypothetical protein